MKTYVGLHTHRHGVSLYVFTAEEMSEADFATYLGDDYESDREDEFLDFEETTPIQFGGA